MISGKMNHIYGVLLLLGGIGLAGAIRVDMCKQPGSTAESFGASKLQDVRISGCAEIPCTLRKGSTTIIEFDFIPDKTYNSLTTSVYGSIGVLRIPFHEVHGTNACFDVVRKADGKRGCPIEAGQLYIYKNSVQILRNYPAMSVTVQYGLNLDDETSAVCFNLPANIAQP